MRFHEAKVQRKHLLIVGNPVRTADLIAFSVARMGSGCTTGRSENILYHKTAKEALSNFYKRQLPAITTDTETACNLWPHKLNR